MLLRKLSTNKTKITIQSSSALSDEIDGMVKDAERKR